MNADTQYVNDILTKHLLDACVESYGISHQVLSLTFRDSYTYDHTLSIETTVTSNIQNFDNLAFDENGRALLLFNKVNLQAITAIGCDDVSTLTIQFADGTKLIFDGSPPDETVIEPWQLGNGLDSGGYSVIAMHGGGYAVFETLSPAT